MTRRLNVKIPSSMMEKVNEISKNDGISKNAVFEQILKTQIRKLILVNRKLTHIKK